MTKKAIMLAGTIAGAWLGGSVALAQQAGTSGASSAPAANSPAQVQALQQQVQSMEAQIAYMKRQIELIQEKVPAKPDPSSATTSLAGGRPTFSSADKNFKFYVTGRANVDYATAIGTPPGLKLNNGVNARRAYLGVGGTLYKNFEFLLQADFGSSSGNENKTSGYLRDANIAYNLKDVGLGNAKLEIGYMEPGFTLERAESSNYILFMERSSPEEVASNYGAADRRFAAGGRDWGDRWYFNAYYTGERSGVGNSTGIPSSATTTTSCPIPKTGVKAGSTLTCTSSTTLSQTNVKDEQSAFIARVAGTPWMDENSLIHVGINGQYVFAPSETTSGVARRTINLGYAPGLQVDGTSFIGTNGSITTKTGATAAVNNATGGTIPIQDGGVIGGELAGAWNSLLVQGEWFHYILETVHPIAGSTAAPTLNFDGYHIDASYVLTGEAHTYDKSVAAFAGVKPAHPFDPAMGDWGAFELALRFDQVNLNDHAGPLLVEGGRQTLYELGVNWYLNNNLRFMLDYIYADIRRAAIIGSGTTAKLGSSTVGNLGPAFNQIGFRTQFNF